MSRMARGACSSSSTHTWGSEDSIGSSPAMLDAWVLKRRARIPAPASWSSDELRLGEVGGGVDALQKRIDTAPVMPSSVMFARLKTL